MILDQINEQFEDKRKYPRLQLGIPVAIVNKDKSLVKGHIFDISPDGLQIRVDRDAALTINPDGKPIKATDKLLVNVIFSLPGDEDKQVKVICNVYYFTLVNDAGDEDVAFGMKFKSFDGVSQKYVDKYLMNALEPAVS